ncbi:C3a anaphylatoxin chemotactic receptor [Trichosurus vulpecula]|uniref:C3a anaphylatoxin chemotactic receptor n=1 Tax=Trichosurus vulpecula TaxID=9337 RepID=UPI00186B3046|nr:C3a anaphylatoxin chemotactic receptor [Trichosurus vulpecula]
MPPSLTNASSSDLIPQPLREPQVMISIAIFSLTFLLGLPGNGLVFWVTGLKMKRTVNTVWFLHLTVADLLCCLSVPFSLVHMVLQGHWPYGWLLCKLIPFIIILNMFASVFLLTAISLDRCAVVLQPIWCQNHRSVRLAFALCAGIWVLAFAMCMPVFLYRETFTKNNYTVCTYNFEEYSSQDYIYFNPSFVRENSLENPSTSELTETMESTSLHPSSSRRDTYPWPSTTLNTPRTPNVVFSAKVTGGHSGSAFTVDSINIYSHHPFSDLSELPEKLPHAESPRIPIVLPEFSNNDSSTDTLRNSDILPYDNAGALPRASGNPLGIPEVTENYLDFIYSYEFIENQLPTTLVAITVTRLVVGFLLPFIIMVVCYTLIVFRLNRGHFAKSRSKTLRVAIVVVVAFFVCWTPYHIIGILSLFASPHTSLGKAVMALDNLSIALASANSCLNPLLYAFMGKDFRQKARQSMQGILEAAFSEDLVQSSSCPQNKTSLTQDIVSTAV